MKKLSLAASVLAAAILTGCVKSEFTDSATIEVVQGNKSNSTEEGAADYVADELIIKFKEGTSHTGIANALSRMGGDIKEHVLTGAMKRIGDEEGFYLVHVPQGVMVALDKAKAFSEVLYAEPNYIYSLPLVPTASDVNDPLYKDNANENLWGMMGMLTSPFKNNYASRAAEAWWDLQPDGPDEDIESDKGLFPQTGSESVYVAVIDQGVEDNHDDFQWKDANGVVLRNNIATQYGYDFVNNDADPSPNHATEDHGTHVAGTIGAIGNNGIGVAGVCWKVNVISMRFLDQRGYGTAANAAKALDRVTELKIQGINIVATNNSWGGLSSKTLQAAITRSEEAGILFVAAAGNSNANNDARASYPSCYPNAGIISVASITVNGAKSDFSSYGKTTVDIAAPGSYIWSTVPRFSELDPDGDGYAKMNGTSMATPHVTGAIALYAAAYGLTPKTKADALAIRDVIMNSARPTKTFQGKCSSNGRLDVHSAVKKINNKGLPAD